MSKVTLFNAQNVEISPDAQTSGTGSLKIPDMAGGTKYLPLSPSAAHAAELAKLGVKGADIASASTTNLETATGELVDVTGTTAITAITLSEGHRRVVRFTGILTLTHGASLVLLGAANILTAAGDVAVFEGYAAGVVRMAAFAKASAAPWSAAVTLAQISDMTAIARAFNALATVGAQRAALDVFPPVARAALSGLTNVIAYSAGIKQSATMSAAATISSITGGSDGATLELWVKGHASVDYVLKCTSLPGSDSLVDMVTTGKTITAGKIWVLGFKYFANISPAGWRLFSMNGGF